MTLYGDVMAEIGDHAHAATQLHLRVLATSDLHAHLLPFDYYRDCRDDTVGLVRVASLIAAARAECPNCLLFDNGDTLQGAPLGDVAATEMLPAGAPHPMITAMNTLGYDAATLGNHDFDFGLDLLQQALMAATFPVVVSNLHHKDGAALRPQRTMLERALIGPDGKRHPIRIGVTGVAPPQLTRWNKAVLGDAIIARDMPYAVAEQARLLRAEGADLVIVLAHSGLGAATPETGMENAARVIAGLPGVDAVVAGHSHGVFPPEEDTSGLVRGTPLVQPGHWGSHLGCIDLALEPPSSTDRRPRWQVVHARATALPVVEGGAGQPSALRLALREHPKLRRTIRAEHRATRRYAAKPLGETAVPLETYFGFIAPCPASQIIADSQRQAAERLLSAEPALAQLPLISAVAPFRCGGRGGPENYTDIPAGPLRLRHASDLYIYTNQLAILRVTGAQVRDWLERVASAFHQIEPRGPGAATQLLHQQTYAGYNFDRLDGLTYRFDLRQPARTNPEGDQFFETPGRVVDLAYADGRPLRPNDELLVVTNSYRAEGGGHFPMCAAAETVLSVPEPIRDLVMEQIAHAKAPLRPEPNRSFEFVGMGGTPVLLETGPGARDHPMRLEALGLRLHGRSGSGFDQYLMQI